MAFQEIGGIIFPWDGNSWGPLKLIGWPILDFRVFVDRAVHKSVPSVCVPRICVTALEAIYEDNEQWAHQGMF